MLVVFLSSCSSKESQINKHTIDQEQKNQTMESAKPSKEMPTAIETKTIPSTSTFTMTTDKSKVKVGETVTINGNIKTSEIIYIAIIPRLWIGLATPLECSNFNNQGSAREIYFPVCASPNVVGTFIEPNSENPDCKIASISQKEHSYPCKSPPCPVIRTWKLTEGGICIKPTEEGKFSVEFVFNQPSEGTYKISAFPSSNYNKKVEVDFIVEK